MSAMVRESVLLGLVGAVSGLCLLYGLVWIGTLGRLAEGEGRGKRGRKGKEGTEEAWWFILVSVCLVGGFYAATLPTKAPFSPGQTLGQGFLLGGGAAIIAHLLTQWGLARLRRAVGNQSHQDRSAGDTAAAPGLAALGGAAISLGLFGLGLGTVAGAFALFHPYPNEALLGLALGACLVAFLGRLGPALLSLPSPSLPLPPLPSPSLLSDGFPLDVFAVWVAALAATTVLGVQHYYESFVQSLNVMVSREVWTGPLTLGAVWLLAAFFGMWAVFGRHSTSFRALLQTGTPRWGRVAGVQVLLAGGLAYFVCVKVLGYRPPFWPLGVGLLTAGVTAWLSATFLSPRGEDGRAIDFPPRGAVEAALLLALALLGALLFSYRRLSAYGVGLCALGGMGLTPWTLAWALAEGVGNGTSAARQRARATALLGHLASLFLLATALFRLFILQQYLTEYRINIYHFEVFVGLALGALMVWGLGWLGLRTLFVVGHESAVPLERLRGCEVVELRDGGELTTSPPHHLTTSPPGRGLSLRAGSWLALGFSLLAGLSTLAGPAFILLFWGVKALAGVLVGASFGTLLLFAAGGILLRASAGDLPRIGFGVAAAVASPVLLGMHLAAVQFTSLLETAVVLTRTQKIEWVAGVVGLWAVWSLILDGRSRGRNT